MSKPRIAGPDQCGPVDEKTIETVAAAAEPTRLTILFLLGSKGRMCVGDIASRFRASRPAISHHLKVLKGSDLVQTEREGQEIYYSVRMNRIVDTLRALADSLDRCCGRAGCQGEPKLAKRASS